MERQLAIAAHQRGDSAIAAHQRGDSAIAAHQRGDSKVAARFDEVADAREMHAGMIRDMLCDEPKAMEHEEYGDSIANRPFNGK